MLVLEVRGGSLEKSELLWRLIYIYKYLHNLVPGLDCSQKLGRYGYRYVCVYESSIVCVSVCTVV